jgi:large subunit ribosomal protein LP1
MASVAPAQLDQATHDELCCTYAALLLYDADIEISADKIAAIINASGNTVGNHCPALFAQCLQSRDVGALLAGVSSGGPGAGAAAPAGDAGAATEEKKEEAKEEEEEEEEDFGFDLFG